MVCGENDTSINVTIPVIMIPQSAGKKLKNLLDHGASGNLFLNYHSLCCKAQHDVFPAILLWWLCSVILYLNNHYVLFVLIPRPDETLGRETLSGQRSLA